MGADTALRDWLRLTLVAGIGSRTQRKLLRAFGLPEAIFAAGHDAWCAVIGDKADGAKYTFGIDPERTRAAACNM